MPPWVKRSSGDMYAGKDGNVYKNTGSGWQKYDNSSGSWNTVNTPQNQQQAQQKAQQQKQSYQHQNAKHSGQRTTSPAAAPFQPATFFHRPTTASEFSTGTFVDLCDYPEPQFGYAKSPERIN